ncbi:Uncharacterised protein [Chlamydia trachomatis]|nr:Uncharacterised protein [Chlamydia trachomatis]
MHLETENKLNVNSENYELHVLMQLQEQTELHIQD